MEHLGFPDGSHLPSSVGIGFGSAAGFGATGGFISSIRLITSDIRLRIGGGAAVFFWRGGAVHNAPSGGGVGRPAGPVRPPGGANGHRTRAPVLRHVLVPPPRPPVF